MTLDRDAARALFDNAEPTPAASNAAPFAPGSPFTPAAAPAGGFGGDPAAYDRMSGRTARKGPDWRLIAPLGVAALCGVAVLVVATRGNDAEPGATVAATEITRPATLPAPVAPPIETAALTPPASSIVEPPAARPTPVIQARVRTEPARRPAATPRTVAIAPSASEASADVSAREPYLPPPVLGAPAVVVVTPVAPAPAPEPVTPPQP